MSDKNKVGRPRTKVEDLPEDWEEIMLECGRTGGSEVEMRVALGIGESAFYTLCEDSTQFQRTRKKAKDLCQVWWEKRGREMAVGEDGNPTVWIFNMKNRFSWRDKQDIEQTVNGSMEHTHDHGALGSAVVDALAKKYGKSSGEGE